MICKGTTIEKKELGGGRREERERKKTAKAAYQVINLMTGK